MFIVVEGPDGVGKTTFVRKLSKRLKSAGYRVRKTQEPFLPIKKVLEILPDMDAEEMYRLFLIDRVAHVNRVINRYSGDGILISDRYWQSTWVYQGLMGVDGDRILRDNMVFPQPDLLIVLTADPETLRRRIRGRGGVDVIEEKIKLEDVIERYERVVEICRDELGIKTLVVENGGDVEKAVEDAYEVIRRML